MKSSSTCRSATIRSRAGTMPKVNDYVERLMDRLDIVHAALEQPAGGAP